MKTIVFDLGNVLIQWDPRNLYKEYLSPQDIEYLLTEVCTMEWNSQMDAGLSFSEGIKTLANQFPEHEPMIRKYEEEWYKMIGGSIDGTVSILEALKREGYPLYALTNWSMETFPPMLSRFEFLSLFEGTVVSAQEGVCKPNERLYQILFERYNIDPNNSIFIDDSYQNVVTARNLGMTALHFKNALILMEELKNHLPEFSF